MAFNYKNAQRFADGLIKKFGIVGVLQKIRARDGQALREIPVTLVTVDYEDMVDYTFILPKDRRCFMSAVGISDEDGPTEEDKMSFNGTIWQIINSKKFQPAAVTTHYELQIRQSQ